MARVLGESGRYASQEAVKKRDAIWARVMIFMVFGGAVMGFSVRGLFPSLKISSWVYFIVTLVLVLVMWRASKWTLKKVDKLDKGRVNWQRGADGEDLVARELGKFPEEFKVINDLTTPFGNLDHVVVGPTGVFLLDAKNWRGVVSADGHGELLCNDKPLDKPYVRQFVGRVMGIKDKVKTLVDLDPYFQPVFVFTSARVNANWGTTKSVHCIRDEQLIDYIVGSKFGKKLKPEDVDKIGQAFLGLAHMDKDFTAKASGNSTAADARKLSPHRSRITSSGINIEIHS